MGMLVKIVCSLLESKRLSKSEHTLLTNSVLKKIGGLPTHAIITVDGSKIFIRGVPLTGEKAKILRESANQAIHNEALKIVHEQVLYNAVSHAVHTAQTFDQVQFGKAAIWFGQQERSILDTLAGETTDELLVQGD